jgi:hypothetical protein
MRHWLVVVLVALVNATLTAPSGVAGRDGPAAHTKKQAELNVLRVVALKWKAWRSFRLVNPRTHLLADNTEAVCHGRGTRRAGDRYARFVCVVRPHAHHGHQGLWLKYRALSGGRFRVRILAYRRW